MREAYCIAGIFRENKFSRIFQNDTRMKFSQVLIRNRAARCHAHSNFTHVNRDGRVYLLPYGSHAWSAATSYDVGQLQD